MNIFKRSLFIVGLISLLGTFKLALAQDCGCTHMIVPSSGGITFDGLLQKPAVKPGDVLCLDAKTSLKRIILRNLVGTKEKPITIKNCGGVAKFSGEVGGTYNVVLVQYSAHLKVTGTGDPRYLYGIKVEGGSNGFSFAELCTDIEVDHVEVANTGFSGIMAKTDPNCNDPRTWRENFTMYNVKLHHNYIHDTEGEGFYIGNSFYVNGAPSTAKCPIAGSTETFKKYAHIVNGVDIYRNVVIRAGCEGIQVGSAPYNCKIHDNVIDTAGIDPFANFQSNGIQIGNGTGGMVYNNFIRFTPANGIICLGIGDNLIFNNLIIESGATDTSTGGCGIFMDEQQNPDSVLGPGMKFINNTIINPLTNGMLIYTNRLPLTTIHNNIVVHLKPNPVFVRKLNKDVILDEKTNLYLTSFPIGLFENPAKGDFRIKSGSIAAGKGTNETANGITFDINNFKRTSNDIGAFAVGTPVYPLSVLDTKIQSTLQNSFFVYPNPVSETTEEITMKFNMQSAGYVSVQSYDIEGKLKDTFGPQFFNAGWNEWKTSKTKSQETKGALVFKLISDGVALDSQIVILK